MLENINDAPLGGADRDPGAPTINVTNVDGGPPGGANGDLKALTINVAIINGGLLGPCEVRSHSPCT
jgi:hypothetical protein